MFVVAKKSFKEKEAGDYLLQRPLSADPFLEN